MVNYLTWEKCYIEAVYDMHDEIMRELWENEHAEMLRLKPKPILVFVDECGNVISQSRALLKFVE